MLHVMDWKLDVDKGAQFNIKHQSLKTAWIGNIGLFFNRNIGAHHVCPLRFQISQNSVIMGRAHLYLLLLQRLTNCVKTYFPILNERHKNSRACDSGAKGSPRHCAAPGKLQCISSPALLVLHSTALHFDFFLPIDESIWQNTSILLWLTLCIFYSHWFLLPPSSFSFQCTFFLISIYLFFFHDTFLFLSWHPSFLATLF